MEHAIGKHRGGFRALRVPTEVYPLLACVSTAVGLLAFYNAFDLFENPEMTLKRTRAKTPAWQRFTADESTHYSHHRQKIAVLHTNPVNTAFDDHWRNISDRR